MSILQAIIIGLVQGLTELFPISSLGHSVILPALFSWHIDQNGSNYLTFLVATHFATAAMLFIFFWKDWMKIFAGLWRSFIAREIEPDDTYARLGWLLVVGTIPAGILGLLFQKPLEDLVTSAKVAADFLILNGIILYMAEKLRKRGYMSKTRRQSDSRVAKLSWFQSAGIGVAQSAALIPGISRSGSSMAASLFAGLNNEDAARFSFLLATPVIGAAAVLKLPGLMQPSAASIRMAALAGAVSAAIAAYISVRFLVRYFQTKNMVPFAAYCVIGGIVYSLILWTR